MRIILAIILLGLGVGALIYAHQLPQRNPETLFLSKNGLVDYLEFKKTFIEKKMIVIKKLEVNEEQFYSELKKLQNLCSDTCEIISPRSIKRGSTKSGANLINLQSDKHLAILISDDNDISLKKILSFTEKDIYWARNVSFAGMPYTNFLLDKYSLVIQEKLFPLMFVLGFVITILFVSFSTDALVVYLPCLFSAGFSLATLKWLFGEMNMVSAIIPLIVFTVTLSLSFHLYFSLKELKTLKKVFEFKWKPFFLMTFTTYIGFVSLVWSEINVIRDFRIVSAHLVLFCTIFTIGWFRLFENGLIFKKSKSFNFMKPDLFKFSLSKKVILFFTVLGGASVFVIAPKLPIVTDATRYFPKDDHVREKILDVTSTVSGIPLAEIHLNLGHDFSALDLQKMEKLEQDLIKAFKMKKANIKLISNNRLVEMANGLYSGVETLPQNLESYLLLRGQLPFSLQESYPVDRDYRLTILGEAMNVNEFRKHLDAIQKIMNRHEFNFKINGLYYNLMLSQEAMINILIESFLSSALIIFVFSAFFLKSSKKIFIFVFVSLLPVALTFVGMKLMGFSFNIATVMTFSISLGLVGDSSFHIIYAKDKRFKSFNEYASGVLFPVVGSGLLLVVCFALFTVNSFVPIREFGGILATVLILGTLVDLYVLPTLLYNSVEHQKNYEHISE